MMHMVVCIKQVVPPPGVPPVISPFDENAAEAALRIKDARGLWPI